MDRHNLVALVSEIDDLNRKMQGRPPRSFLDSPFGVHDGGRKRDPDVTEISESVSVLKKGKRKPKA